MPKYYGYIRTSSHTPETQKHTIQTYCEKNKITLDGIFIDIKSLEHNCPEHERPELWKLFDAFSDGDIIIAKNTSTLWRDDAMKAIVCRLTKKQNGHIISIEQPYYSIYEPQWFLFNSIMEIMDQYDRMREASYSEKCSCCDKILR